LHGTNRTINRSYYVLLFNYNTRITLFIQICVLACSFYVAVSSSLLYIATVYLVLPCSKRVSGSPELGWVIVSRLVGIGGAGWLGIFLWLMEF
jgi:hypothetical protein